MSVEPLDLIADLSTVWTDVRERSDLAADFHLSLD